jgi:hypothetical protein
LLIRKQEYQWLRTQWPLFLIHHHYQYNFNNLI